jgi:putative redox protein
LEITIQSEQDGDPPFHFKSIHLHFTLWDESLKEKSVDQAIRLSMEKYCSVAATIRGVADITHSFEVKADTRMV